MKINKIRFQFVFYFIFPLNSLALWSHLYWKSRSILWTIQRYFDFRLIPIAPNTHHRKMRKKTEINCFWFQFQQPSSFPIVGIRHMDYKSHPVKVDIINGGIGQRAISLHLKSQRGHGINSTFIFYTIWKWDFFLRLLAHHISDLISCTVEIGKGKRNVHLKIKRNGNEHFIEKGTH